ncbi:MAG: aminoacetone oxidase family FAD-binding enzyme [Bacilli bacterium]|nr:aminoacetone oxidase family FAD-binding enzyme [Bacilli bacterium]
MKVAVIGGGASGVIAALKASEHADVILIEGNNKIGKKILITGNGKCNFWNKVIDTTKYNSNNLSFLNGLLARQDEVYNFLTKTLGITPTEKNGYIYPRSKTASSLSEALSRALNNRNVDILYNLKVKHIKISDNAIILSLNDNTELKVDKVIVATGSKAVSKTGSDGSGYDLLKALGVKIVPVTPALVPLKISDDEKKLWSGVRGDAKLTIIKDDKQTKEERGEIQLTDYGISGIVTFNISSLVSNLLINHDKININIDFIPEIDNLENFFEEKNRYMNAPTIEELLETIFNYKLLQAILRRADLKKEMKWSNLNIEEKGKLINAIKNFQVDVIGTEDYDKAQVCRGGVSLSEIDNTFSLKTNKNIKVIGEILDVDGKCGGYNLAFAFISGYIAGDEIND